MSETGMTQVVSQRDRLRQILVEAEGPRIVLANLETSRVCVQSRPVMITHGNEKDLGFMLQSPKRLRMDDSISVVLESGRETFLFKRWAAFRT